MIYSSSAGPQRGFMALISSEAQLAVSGNGNRLSWVGAEQRRRDERQTGRQTETCPSGETGHGGHMTELQTGWCAAAACLSWEPQNLWSLC